MARTDLLKIIKGIIAPIKRGDIPYDDIPTYLFEEIRDTGETQLVEAILKCKRYKDIDSPPIRILAGIINNYLDYPQWNSVQTLFEAKNKVKPKANQKPKAGAPDADSSIVLQMGNQPCATGPWGKLFIGGYVIGQVWLEPQALHIAMPALRKAGIEIDVADEETQRKKK